MVRRSVVPTSGAVVERVPGPPAGRSHGQPLITVRRVDTGKQLVVPRRALVPLSTWERRNRDT